MQPLQFTMNINYHHYLNFINEKLKNFFEIQEPYIFCHKGCSLCCKNSQFPYSQIEIQYLKEGIAKLEDKLRSEIQLKIKKIIEKKKNYKGKNFRYDCPFLINNECTIYEHRGILCRAFGLMTHHENGKVKVPFCCYKGLNYSNVMNLQKKTISVRKFKKLATDKEPLGFNISYVSLTHEDFEEEFNLKFGEKKPLIDWFID